MANLQTQREFLAIQDLVEEILAQTGYLKDLENQKTLEADARIDNIHEFISVTQEFDKRWEAEQEDREQAAQIAAQEEADRPTELQEANLNQSDVNPGNNQMVPSIYSTLKGFKQNLMVWLTTIRLKMMPWWALSRIYHWYQI